MRAIVHIAAGDWTGGPADTVTLDYDSRWRRRLTLSCENGLTFILDLPQAVQLRDGDGLRLEDGRIVEVRAAPEPVADFVCRDTHHLVKLAWHLGNRHLPTQIMPDRLRVRQDHVIEAMAAKLGAEVVRLDAPFDPEGGAYGHGRTHGHDHGHSHDHHHHGHGHHHG